MRRPYTYDEILRAKPMLGSVKFGEIETSPIFSADEGLGPYGVLYQDRWVTIVRDPITFPNYSPGAHIRIIEGDPHDRIFGAVILAIRPNLEGSFDIAFVRQWRHVVNGWTCELPRGGTGPGENIAAGALRELREETGLRRPEMMIHLGDMANNTGISATVNSYFLVVYLGHARVIQREQQETEAINNVLWAPFSEWREIVSSPPIPGRPVGPLDGYTAAAFGLAYMTGYLKHVPHVWKHMYGRDILNDARVSTYVKENVAKGLNEFDLKVTCSDEAVVAHFLRELPLLNVQPAENPAELHITGASLLMLSWFACTDAVLRIDAL